MIMLYNKHSYRWLKLAVAILPILALNASVGMNAEVVSAVGDKIWTDNANEPLVWTTLLALSPIRSPRDFYLHHRAMSLIQNGATINSCQLEIRSADNKLRMAKINCDNFFYEYIHKNKLLKWSEWRDNLYERQTRRLEPLDDGEYLLAININRIRCSNVFKIQVNSNFDSALEPTLQLLPLEVGPGKKLRFLGIQAIGPVPKDPFLTNKTLSFPELVVDGVRRKIMGYVWDGLVFPLKSSQQYEQILDLRRYKPSIDLEQKHTVKAIVGKYESAPVVIGLDKPLGQAWDQATATIKPRVPPPAALKGKVIGPDGNPSADYEVRLQSIRKRDGEKRAWFTEYTRKNGKYDFPNVPPGEYKLNCHTRSETEPQLMIEHLQITEHKTLIKDISFERKHSFSGKVNDEAGNPMIGITVTARWEVMGGNITLRDVTTTDDHGHYMLAAPFEVATSVAVGHVGPDFVPPIQSRLYVKAGSNNVDFVIWTRTGRKAAVFTAFKELSVEIDKAVHNVSNDPSLVLSLFIRLQNKQSDLPKEVAGFAQKYICSENPLVRFCAEWTTADVLYRQMKDPSALIHFDCAIESKDDAYAIISKHPVHHDTIDDIYRHKISACLYLGKPEIARETALRGANYFMGVNRFNHAIDWLFFYCVTEILNQKDAEQGLAICDAYLKAHKRDRGMHQAHYLEAIIEARKTFTKALAEPQNPR